MEVSAPVAVGGGASAVVVAGIPLVIIASATTTMKGSTTAAVVVLVVASSTTVRVAAAAAATIATSTVAGAATGSTTVRMATAAIARATTRAATVALLVCVAAVAALVASLSPSTAGDGVCRRFEPAGSVSMEHLDPLVEVGHKREESVDGGRLRAHIQRGDNRLVLHVESSNDEGDEFSLPDRFARRCKLVGERSHVPEVGRSRLGSLLRIRERGSDVVDAR